MYRLISSIKTPNQGNKISVPGPSGPQQIVPTSAGNPQETQSGSAGNAGPGQLPYGELHQIVLQNIMNAKGLLAYEQLSAILKNARKFCKIPHPTTREEDKLFLQAVCKSINEKLNDLNLVISIVGTEHDTKRFYMFGLLNPTPITKLQNYFSQMEIELFYRIIELIFTTDVGFCIPQNTCLNERCHLRSGKLSLSKAEQLIKEMEQRSYFLIMDMPDKTPGVTVGIRGVKELESYLVENYPGSLVQCGLCKKYLLHGYRCGECPTYVHRYCYKKYKEQTKDSCMCINCKSICWALRHREGMLVRTRIDIEPNPADAQGDSDPDTVVHDNNN